MASLPAINAHSSTRAKQLSSRRKSRFMTWQDRERLKHQRIRDEKQTMTKVETTTHRNTYKHNLCVNILKDGFHRSFDEIFSLIEKRKKQREAAGQNSSLWQEKSLDDQTEKLAQMALHLTQAEAAERVGKWEEVYECRHRLAEYFLSTQDNWLSDHFFQSALDTSLKIRLDGRRREAEAHCNMGLADERNSNNKSAAEHMEQFHQISTGQTWINKEDVLHSAMACRHLCRIYTLLSEESGDPSEQLNFLLQAFDVSKEGEDGLQTAQTALKLGRQYESTGDSETAIQYLTQSLEAASSMGDKLLVGDACEALARSHQTQGNAPKSIEYLEEYAKTSRENDHKSELADASNCLGNIYNILGFYDRSVEHFSSAYDVSNEIGSSSIASAVQLGVAKGNHMLGSFNGNMEIEERYMMERIIHWKDQLSESQFGTPLPTDPVVTPPTPEKIPDPTEPFEESKE